MSSQYSLESTVEARNQLKAEGKTLVMTNGCFDILHAGHLQYLKQASTYADQLWIALNSDSSVEALKGPKRPIVPENERAFHLTCLEFVNRVFIFNEPRLTKEILAIKPDVYVKASDYTLETLNPEERQALESVGAQIEFMDFVPGFSTTAIIEKIEAQAHVSY